MEMEPRQSRSDLYMDPIAIEHRLTKVEAAVECIPSIQETLADINKKFARYEGKWGVISLIVGAVWAALITFKDDLIKLIK